MSAIIIPRRARPSWATGFAREQSDARFPCLREQLAWHYAPQLGATGGTLMELTGRGVNATLEDGPTWNNDSIHFDAASSDHLEIPDNPSLTLPDSDWAIAGWIRIGTQVNGFPYFMTWNTVAATPSIVYGIDDSAGTSFFRVVDNDGTDSSSQFTSGTVANNTGWQHVVIQRSGQTITGYWDTVDQHNWSWTTPTFDEINYAGAWWFASRFNQPTTRAFVGDLGGWAKWNRALSPSEIQLLSDRPNAILERKARVFPVATEAPPVTGNPWNYYAQQAALVG